MEARIYRRSAGSRMGKVKKPEVAPVTPPSQESGDGDSLRLICKTCNLPVPIDEYFCPECGAETRVIRCVNCKSSLNDRKSVVRTYFSKDPEKYDDVNALGHYDVQGFFESERSVSLQRHDLAMDSDQCAKCGFVLPF